MLGRQAECSTLEHLDAETGRGEGGRSGWCVVTVCGARPAGRRRKELPQRAAAAATTTR